MARYQEKTGVDTNDNYKIGMESPFTILFFTWIASRHVVFVTFLLFLSLPFCLYQLCLSVCLYVLYVVMLGWTTLWKQNVGLQSNWITHEG